MHYKSKVDIIYEKILDDIINGTYRQGDRIVISKLAKDNKVSDIPVREAMRRIESEGLVKIVANHGAVVTQHEPEDIEQYYILNAIIGGYATRVSADYLDEFNLMELSRINEEMKRAAEMGDIEKYLLYDESFHVRIYSSIPYPIVYKAINKMLLRRLDKQSRPSKEWQLESVEIHQKIIEMLREKKYDEVEMLTRNHILDAAKKIVEQLKKEREEA